MLRLGVLLLFGLFMLTQCRPCELSSCGCYDDFEDGLQIINEMDARFVPAAFTSDTMTYFFYNNSVIDFRVTNTSPLANQPTKNTWSIIPTAAACDPAYGYNQATTYLTDIAVIAQKSDTLQQLSWAAGDTITTNFVFAHYYGFKPIPEFLALHDKILIGVPMQMRLNTSPGGQKRLKVTVHFKMSGGDTFTFPDIEMRVR